MKFRGYKGFALPTILIVSVTLMSVLVVASVSVSGIRANMTAQYYNQIAKNASEAGLAYAKACIDANGGIAQWSNSNPLRPYTYCDGTTISGLSCTSSSTDPMCYVMLNGNIRSTFSVNFPSVDSYNQYVSVSSIGSVNLVRPSNNVVWRTYSRGITMELGN